MGTEDGGDDGRQRGTGEVPPAQGHPGAMVTVGGSCLPPPGTRIAAVPNKQQGAGSSAALSSLALTRQRPPPALSTGTPCPQPPSPPRDPPYLSMMTGSEGVSLRFPQLFLSQQRLGTRGGGHEGGVWVQPQRSTPTPKPPHDGERGSCPIGRVLGCGWGHRHGWSRLGTWAARCHCTGVGGPPAQPPPMTSGPDLGSLGTGLQRDPAAQGSPQPHTFVTPWGRGTAPIGTR